MLRAVLLSLFFLVSGVWAQDSNSIVSAAQLDAAEAAVTAHLAADDPERTKLLKLYADTRAALGVASQFQESYQAYARARAGANREAAAIEAGLAERHLSMAKSGGSPRAETLADVEQRMQLSKADLEARKSRLTDIRAEVSGMPDRATKIRARLTELGGLLPQLQSQRALMPKAVDSGSVAEAELWLAQAQNASALAEKSSLDEELLSQPMRLQLLMAQQDRGSQDIGEIERHLRALDSQASKLRLGAASQAQSEAQMVIAETKGKHPLVQSLADKNAELTVSFHQLGIDIEQVRQRDLEVTEQVERLGNDLNSIEHKLRVLGMSTSVGHILREQQVQLPSHRAIKKDIAVVASQMAEASIRQIELEDYRRKLLDARVYVDQISVALDAATAAATRDDLLELVRSRRELVRQALELEATYTAAMGDLEFDLRRYEAVAGEYRQFINERLLWIPSRAPFSLQQGNTFLVQLKALTDLEPWRQLVLHIPGELQGRPHLGLLLALVLVLISRSARIKARIVATGREVGYVRTDVYSNTMAALGLSLLQSLKWPLLMWTLAQLFQLRDTESNLGTALHDALSRGALYFWGLEFLRTLLMPKGLMVSHFRWPSARAEELRTRTVRLEQTFVPAVLAVGFSIGLHPLEVGGPLGAFAVILLLLSIAYFFRQVPEYMESKVAMVLTDGSARQKSATRRLLRVLLVWVPLAATVVVLYGYVYTAVELSLLLVRTITFCGLMLLFNELGLRWLRLTRRRMVVKVRAEVAQASAVAGEVGPEEEILENDPELLSDEGTKFINMVTMFGVIAGVLLIWTEVIPALGILDSVELWQQTDTVDGQLVPVPVTLGDVIGALLIAVLGWLALRRIPSLLEILLRQKIGVRPASAYAATRIFQYAATAGLVIGVLSTLGGSWSQIQWAVAALSVGIGFGLQEIVANFISGLIILFEQPIRVGDTVTVGGISGKVTKIRIRATTIRDFDNRELLVPNKEFITQQLLNWSLSDPVTRWIIEVGVAYGTDLEKAMAIVGDVARQHPLVLEEPAPVVTFEQFGDSSLRINLRFFMDQLDQRIRVSSAIMLEINRRFNEQGIVVSFPQRDVHLDISEPLEFRMVDGHRNKASAADQ